MDFEYFRISINKPNNLFKCKPCLYRHPHMHMSRSVNLKFCNSTVHLQNFRAIRMKEVGFCAFVRNLKVF